jgi:hypothetical protein
VGTSSNEAVIYKKANLLLPSVINGLTLVKRCGAWLSELHIGDIWKPSHKLAPKTQFLGPLEGGYFIGKPVGLRMNYQQFLLLRAMPLVLATVNWVGVLYLLLITAAAVVTWAYLLRGVFGVVRDFFRGVRKHDG